MSSIFDPIEKHIEKVHSFYPLLQIGWKENVNLLLYNLQRVWWMEDHFQYIFMIIQT